MIKHQHFFNNIFRAIEHPSMVLQPVQDDYLIVNASESYFQMTGSHAEDLLGKPASEVFPTAHNQNGLAVLLESFGTVSEELKKHETGTFRYDIPVRGTGEYVEKYWVSINSPILDPQGNLEYILHQSREVTQEVLAGRKERKLLKELTQKQKTLDQKKKELSHKKRELASRQEELNRNQEELDRKKRELSSSRDALARNQEQYLYFVEKNTDALYSLDLEGNFTSANEGLVNAVGVPMEELLASNFLRFCYPPDQEKVVEHFKTALDGSPVKFEGRFVSVRGEQLTLDISLIPMRVEGRIEGCYGIARDITGIRRTEQVMMEKSRFLATSATFISTLLKEDLNQELLEEAFGRIGKAVDVDRMYYYSVKGPSGESEAGVGQKIGWTSERFILETANPEVQDITEEYLGELFGSLSKHEPYARNLSELSGGAMKKLFMEQGIKAMLVMPVFLKDRLYGFIGFDDCRRERSWNTDEINFMQSLADNLSSTLEKRAAERALREREELLRKSEQKFKALVQEGSDIMAILDSEGRYKFASNSRQVVLGTKAEDFLGQKAWDYIHPEDLERVRKDVSTFRKGRKRIRLAPYRYRDQQGHWRWMQTTLTDLRDDPAVDGIVVNSRDISTLINQAREIEEISERYQLAARATKDLIYDWDMLSDKVTRFHKNTEEVFGYTLQEVEQRTFWRSHVHPDEVEALRRYQNEMLEDPDKNFIHTEYRFKRADGSYAHLKDSAYIIRDHDGRPLRMVGATTDISDLKSNEEALRLANERFKMAMKATKEMIWDWDLGEDRVERSDAFSRDYGYHPEEHSGMEGFWLKRIHPDDQEKVKKSLYSAIADRGQDKWREEYRFLPSDGEIVHLHDRAFILRDEKGKAIRMVGAVLDVTESRKTLRQIEQQNLMLKEIAWEQSHLVRAPLARLQSLLELLEQESFEGFSEKELWHHIKQSTLELDGIIRQIVRKSEGLEDQNPSGTVS